ncbi:MAG TPA: methyltransferase domain-containing protein [Thermodesulfobacteriota bacterium]
MTAVDFGRVAYDYARYRAGFPDAFFDRLLAAGYVTPGDRVLDLGTGTGALARGLARRGCRVTGLDRSAALLAEARRLDREAGDIGIGYVEGLAEDTGLPGAAFDVVTAGQCWHWFDRPRAAREAHRVLRPAGRLVIAQFDSLPLPGSVMEATVRLIAAYNPGWQPGRTAGLHPEWLIDMATSGFEGIETFSFDLTVRYGHEAWRGRVRASAGVGASLPPDAVARFDAELAALLATDFPDEPLDIPHRVWAAVGVATRR